jgi:hypothetical protein
MRRFPTTLIIALAALVFVIGGLRLFWNGEHQRYRAVNRVLQQQSKVLITETITHAKGPLEREEWTLANDNGTSTASYEAVNRAGTRVARFTYPIKGYDVTFAFQKLVLDGIWEVRSRPLLGNTNDIYTVTIAQTAGDRSGSHRFVFTDPHYLATTAGRQYSIHLDPHKPVPDLLTLQSTSSADPRYQQIVDDFQSFGPPGFRTTVAAARRTLLHS